ncbi:unnamed protein product, partial [Polarella glacialis]
VDELTQEVERQQRRNVARKLWSLIASDKPELTLDEFFKSICGQQVEKSTGEVLVNLLRPMQYEGSQASSSTISKDVFSNLVVEFPEEIKNWIDVEFFPRFTGEPPFQKELMEAIQASDLLPYDTNLISDAVKLDPHLIVFLEAVAEASRG